jgi:hypothetical protein
MLRIDPEKIEAELAAMQKAMALQANLPGPPGAIARMQMAVLPALTRWRTAEINRDVNPNDVANALVALFAATLYSEVTTVYGTEIDDDHYQFLNKMMLGIGQEVGAFLEGNRPGVTRKFIGGSDVGTA